MRYSFDIGKVRALSLEQGTHVIHELRHYGSLINTFRTDEPKHCVPKILEEHYSMLAIKHLIRDVSKRFPLTQPAVDIAELYFIMTSADIHQICQRRNHYHKLRDFEATVRKSLELTLPLK